MNIDIQKILRVDKAGLYCIPGDFYIDAWGPANINFVTHAHSDHAKWGSQHYVCTPPSQDIIKLRLGQDISIESLPYNEKRKYGDAWVSLHPAGHIIGSAQIRIETKEGITVFSGDYKRTPDNSCEPFEIIPCDIFITESTFGLPIYQWPKNEQVVDTILSWWKDNATRNVASVLYCYALGKAQRILNLLAGKVESPIYLHGAIIPYLPSYKRNGAVLAPSSTIGEAPENINWGQQLILAPPSAENTPWLKRFYPYSNALASGWMKVRGSRRRQGLDRGIVLSDHADWNELIQTIKDTNASQVYVVHGNVESFSKYVREEMGIKAAPLKGEALIPYIEEDNA